MMKPSSIAKLERQGCYSNNWDDVSISPHTDLRKIRNVVFRGKVTVGAHAEIINVPGGLKNLRIGDNVRINNVAKIENSDGATCGIGTSVAVLDETGSRRVRIYPGISAQTATIAARMPEYAEDALAPLIEKHLSRLADHPEIGDNAEIFDCGPLIDVRIWKGVKIEGAARLRNCSVVSNAGDNGKSTFIGPGVDAENCIIEDATVGGGSFLRNSYVGQGTIVDKGFTSHDSLFFSNCTMENGETCAVLAGPFTVSMHKSTLLIACQTAFMNAGSGTNMSNHMYKLGPVHWGVLDRGVKTSSNSYLMHGSRIGAFSLLMGDHKQHPDSSDFPFSYLIGDPTGNTAVVPGAMLRSCGIVRDDTKWKNRDRRKKLNLTKLNDRIDSDIFNPYTISMMADAIDTAEKLLDTHSEEESIIHKGMKISLHSLAKGKRLYELAICKYVSDHMRDAWNDAGKTDISGIRWLDIAGQVITESNLREALKGGSIEEIERLLSEADRDLMRLEQAWISQRFAGYLKGPEALKAKAQEYEELIEKDRNDSIRRISDETAMLSLL